MLYMQYRSTPQPIAVMAPINTFAAPKTVFGLPGLYYPFYGHFTWYSAKYSIGEHIPFIRASIYALITQLFSNYILQGLAMQHTRNRPYGLFLSWKHESVVWWSTHMITIHINLIFTQQLAFYSWNALTDPVYSILQAILSTYSLYILAKCFYEHTRLLCTVPHSKHLSPILTLEICSLVDEIWLR